MSVGFGGEDGGITGGDGGGGELVGGKGLVEG